jgi:hypothetical protein
LDYFQKPPLGSRPDTKSQEIVAFQTLATVDLFYFYYVGGLALIEFH